MLNEILPGRTEADAEVVTDSSRPAPSAALARVLGEIWPDARVAVLSGPALPAGAQARDYLVLPRMSEPRWLLPVGARVPLTDLAAPSGALRRWGLRGAGALLGSDIGRWLPLPRVRVQPGLASDTASDTGQTTAPTTAPELSRVLAEAVGAASAEEPVLALRLGRWHQPRAVVLRIFSTSGRTLGFAKLGLDPVGQASVRAETAGLGLAASLGLHGVEAPVVLHAGTWRGRELVVTSPLVGGRTRRTAPSLPAAAMEELARARSGADLPLTDSAWHASVLARLDSVVDAGARAGFAPALALLGTRAARDGVRLPLGCWHGDWTPWNMSRRSGRVLLWDWEHAATGVPVGFDHVHYLAQLLRVAAGTDAQAERRWVEDAAAVLATRIGLDSRQRDLLLIAYLVEVNLRYVLDRQATSQRGEPRDGWGPDLLADRVRRAEDASR